MEIEEIRYLNSLIDGLRARDLLLASKAKRLTAIVESAEERDEGHGSMLGCCWGVDDDE